MEQVGNKIISPGINFLPLVPFGIVFIRNIQGSVHRFFSVSLLFLQVSLLSYQLEYRYLGCSLLLDSIFFGRLHLPSLGSYVRHFLGQLLFCLGELKIFIRKGSDVFILMGQSVIVLLQLELTGCRDKVELHEGDIEIEYIKKVKLQCKNNSTIVPSQMISSQQIVRFNIEVEEYMAKFSSRQIEFKITQATVKSSTLESPFNIGSLSSFNGIAV